MRIKLKPTLSLLTLLFLMLMIISYMLSFVPKYYTFHFAFLYNFFKILSVSFSLYYIILHIGEKIKNRENMKINKIILSLFILVLYELIVLFVTPYQYDKIKIIDLIGWPLLFFQFYIESYESNIKENFGYLVKIFIVVVYYASFLLIQVHLNGMGLYGTVVFPIYFCITFLPLLFYFSRTNIEKNIYFLISVTLLILSTKRAGFLALVVGYISYLLVRLSRNKNEKNKIIKLVLFFVVGFVVTKLIISISNLEIINRIVELSKDNGSGRTLIWQIIIDSIQKSSFAQVIFGHGFEAVPYLLKPQNLMRFAHNSYLEYLYDYGVVGLTLLLNFLIKIIINCYKSYKNNTKNFDIYTMSLIIIIFLSLFSYTFEEFFIVIPIIIMWAINEGNTDKENVDYERE